MSQSYMFEGIERDKLISKMEKVKTKLLSLLGVTFQTLCYQYKQACRQITLFLKTTFKKYTLIGQECWQILGQCLRILETIVKSLQIEKYGHLFPTLSYTIRKYEELSTKKLESINKTQLLNRMDKNQQSQYFQQFIQYEISETEKKFKQRENFNEFLNDLREDQVILQDRQCVCCARVFIKNFQIVNKNRMIRNVFQIQEIKGIDRITLEKFFTGVCTQGGGIVIIGAERQENQLKAIGINFSSMQEIAQTQIKIMKALRSVKPFCNFYIQRVLVHTNYADPQKISQENMRVCFRVSVYPVDYRKITYVSYALKGRSEIFQSYRLQDMQKPIKIQNDQDENNPKTIYTYMHKKYQTRKNPPVNSHRNIKCNIPYQNYSKILYKYVQEGNPLSNSSTTEQENISQKIYDPDVKFKYQFASLLVTSSKKHERWIENYEDQLKSKKIAYQLFKPYPNSFKNCGRPVWMISHQLFYADMKAILRQLQSIQKVKPGAIKIMPIGKNLQIQSQKLTQKSQQFFNKKFKSRFTENYTKHIENIQTESGNVKTIFYGFNDYSQAIYAYMIFQELQLRPYFVRQGDSYKKKSKNSKQL